VARQRPTKLVRTGTLGRNALGARIWRLLMAGRALVTGATGFVGSRLALALAQAGWEVRGMVRNRAASRARELEQSGLALHEGDVLRPQSLRGAGRGVDVAYYLIHSMGRGGSGDFVASERAAATSFAQMARKEKIERVVYLGGLGDRPHSKHLRSRHETALALAEHGPPLTYFRAGMVVGAQSESYRTLRHLVQRLPAMIAPAWLKNATQPIAIDDTLRYLVQAPGDRRLDRQGDPDRRSGRSEPRRDARSHGDGAQSPPPPAGTRPFHHTWLSSLWIGVVTPVDAGVARPLVEGLAVPTVVTDPSGAQPFDVQTMTFDEALRRAVAEDPELRPRQHVAP
jgi:uncharacterized protein YbjT (DUF2867 family)